ncbi:unnamed protein product [Withania somnifera]
MEVLHFNETITPKLSLPPAKSPLISRTNRLEKKSDCRSKFPASPRSSHVSRRPVRSTATSHYSLRKVYGSANKEIIKRALTPPARRLTLRWLDFKPTPSRLCNMSAA